MPKSISQLIYSGLTRGILTLLLIIVITIVVLRLVNMAADAIERRFIATSTDIDRRSRLHTLHKAVKSTVVIIILFISVLMGLSAVGVDIGPALTAAGILGLTVSLGAQTLIKDVIGGLTILLEDEYRVGDQVRIGTSIGEVEKITLRRTDLRDSEGRLLMVPNGDVRVVANETRDWARALVELKFGLDTDVSHAVAVLDGALSRLADDPLVQPYLLDKPEIFGWNAISDASVVVRLSAKVVAGKQPDVARPMRQYAFEALQEAGLLVNVK